MFIHEVLNVFTIHVSKVKSVLRRQRAINGRGRRLISHYPPTTFPTNAVGSNISKHHVSASVGPTCRQQ